MEPIFNRVESAVWKRGNYIFENTLSLDFHALIGSLMVMGLLVQVLWGAGKAQKLNFHKKWGRFLARVIFPSFILIAVWAIVDRSINIDASRSVIFRADKTIICLALSQLLIFSSGFFIKSIWAIKKKDLEGHVEWFLMSYIIIGGVAYLRLFYMIIWFVNGRTPLSMMSVYFMTLGFCFCLIVSVISKKERVIINLLPLSLLLLSTFAMIVWGDFSWYENNSILNVFQIQKQV